MEIDYHPYLTVLQDGSIWWQLTDAVKLGAGYLPVYDHRNGTPELRAKNNQIVADTRTLLGEFGADRYTAGHPRLVERDGIRYVEAHDFLDWLVQWLPMQPGSTMHFPNELAHAVRAAGGNRVQESALPRFESLTLALEGHFEKLLADLPRTLRTRVTKEFFPLPWDQLTPEQRRSGTLQWDYQRDPATEDEREFWWNFYVREDDLKKQIAHWADVQTPSASDLALKEVRLTELRRQLAHMEQQRRLARGDYYPTRPSTNKTTEVNLDDPDFPYVAYPKVMAHFARVYGSTPEELAAWVWWGTRNEGISAYLNANELVAPPRFQFPVGTDDFEYVPYMMACWFKKEDVANFIPAERYITGAALLERWNANARPGLHAKAFVMAKIAESRLMESHPLFGLTQGSCPEHADFPPLESGLFALSEVEAIESTDFDEDVRTLGPGAKADEQKVPGVGSLEWRQETARKAANARHDKPGGSRDKQSQIREIWASGKYSTREICAEQECAALGMSFAACRKALRNTPEPSRS